MIEIKRKEDCCGCSACANVCGAGAIALFKDEEGFVYPRVDQSICTDCGLCEKVCPIINRKGQDLEKPRVKSLFAGWLADQANLRRSASGGAFWALARQMIADGGVVFGAVYDSDMKVVHDVADTLDGCRRFQGSKYSQSDISEAMRHCRSILRKGRRVLFTGTPCQIDGLKRFLIKEYENLLTMDVVCHAVPSPRIFAEYVDYAGRMLHGSIADIRMRDKSTTRGWFPPYTFKYIMRDGKEYVDPEKVINWSEAFGSGLINRPSCHEYKYTNLNRVSDITVADFWDFDNLRPDLRTNKGTSLVMANTSKGLDMINRISYDLMELSSITIKEGMQPRLKSPSAVNPLREQFWADYNKKGFTYAYKKYFGLSRTHKMKRIVKKILSVLGFKK